jgi:hypothetical protein
MRLPRVLIAVLAAGAVLLSTQIAGATQATDGAFNSVIYALNANDRAAVASHLAPNFQLTFTGGTTVTGTEALDMLMLLDTPIKIVFSGPTGNLTGSAVVTFDADPIEYAIEYTLAPDGKFATWTIASPDEPPSP